MPKRKSANKYYCELCGLVLGKRLDFLDADIAPCAVCGMNSDVYREVDP